MGVRVQRNPAKVPKKKSISSMAKPKVALMMKKKTPANMYRKKKK